jgi:hypothetical protein
MKTAKRFALLFLSAVCLISTSAAQWSSIAPGRLINPEDLAKMLQPGKDTPLMLQVGSRMLFLQAHIAGSEYVGAGANETGLKQLRKRVESLPRNKFIILYCGCCPWNHCPNVKPADDALRTMGFTNVKVLYLADNFGTNWVDKGYPTAKGE